MVFTALVPKEILLVSRLARVVFVNRTHRDSRWALKAANDSER